MSTLLIRLAAPLQSWGTDSKFDIRQTGREPSKSGVVGLLAAALGWKRDADLSELNKLRFGVRVDQEGQEVKDFHMARKMEKGKLAASYLTYRYYLSDAVFLVGLESEDRMMLENLEAALKEPVFPLFLGRRSCPPSMPLVIGIREKELVSALQSEPWMASEYMQKKLTNNGSRSWELRLKTDSIDGTEGGRIKDVPDSFNPEHRKYHFRKAVEHGFKEIPAVMHNTEHDAMQELR